LVQAGVIDPTKVVRSALQNAASIASLLLTTEAVVSQIPERDQHVATSAGGMGGLRLVHDRPWVCGGEQVISYGRAHVVDLTDFEGRQVDSDSEWRHWPQCGASTRVIPHHQK
jgi:hypothetical protein